MKKNWIVKLMSIILCLSVIVAPSSTALAATNVNSNSLSANGGIEVKVINNSEVRFIVKNDHNDIIEAVVTKNEDTVNSVYYFNTEMVLRDQRKLVDAEKLGNQCKKERRDFEKALQMKGVQSDSGSFTVNSIVPFDGLAYNVASDTGTYFHISRGTYGVSQFTNWSKDGTNYNHTQLDMYTSSSIIQAPAWAIGSGIGAAIGYRGGMTGAVVGAVIGGALGAVFGSQALRILDECSCIWFVIDNTPTLKNYGTTLFPQWFMVIDYIAVGPFTVSNYLYPVATGNPY